MTLFSNRCLFKRYEFKLRFIEEIISISSIIIRNVEIITHILIQETPLDMIARTVSKLY